MISLLLAEGADTDLQSSNGHTPLHNAAGGGHTGVVEQLLAGGADMDVQNSNGNTPLHMAASKGAGGWPGWPGRGPGSCRRIHVALLHPPAHRSTPGTPHRPQSSASAVLRPKRLYPSALLSPHTSNRYALSCPLLFAHRPRLP